MSAKPTLRQRLSYAATHWGRRGSKLLDLVACDCKGELVGLGKLREIVYETVKGNDPAPTEYQHEFSRRSPPVLAYCVSCRRLVIAGGTYKVTWRGIVG